MTHRQRPSIVCFGVLAGLAILTAASASGAERAWIKTGMSGAEAMQAIAGQCASVQQGPPDITCIDGKFGIYATVSTKDRVYYVKRYEPMTLQPAEYAARTAKELGFAGDGVACQRYNERAYCWESEDGTKLFSGMLSNESDLSTQLLNERIKQEDDEP